MHRRGIVSSFWVVVFLSGLVFAGLVVLLWSPWDKPAVAGKKTLRFYCAAGIRVPVDEIMAGYGSKYDVTFEPTYDSSGSLLSTIRGAGGTGDLYLSGDAEEMVKAQKLGLVEESIPVALVRPVLIVNRKTQQALREQGKPVQSIQDLLRDDLAVVLANPEHTAVGKVTRERLEAAGLWDKVRNREDAKYSEAGTVSQVANTVAVKDNYIGVVWSAVATQFDALEAIPVPEFADATEQVTIGVLGKSKEPTAALQFARYLAGRNKGQEIFIKHHFEPVPDADTWEEAPELFIDAGAMLKPAIDDVIQAFEKREGVRITTTYNGCGLLVSKMRAVKKGDNPAHFPDAYVSCDVSFQERVQPWFEAASIILENDMVIVVAKGNPKKVTSLEDLKRPALRVGVPHPENSALGELIDRLLMRLGLHGQVYGPNWQKRVVHSDAAHTLVNQLRTGALDVIVVGRSNALSSPENVAKYIDVIDIDVAGAMATQTFAVAKDSSHKYLMQRLLRAIVTDANAVHMQSIGFRFKYESKPDGNR